MLRLLCAGQPDSSVNENVAIIKPGPGRAAGDERLLPGAGPPAGCHLKLSGNIDNYTVLFPVKSWPTQAVTVESWMETEDATRMGTPFSYNFPKSNGRWQDNDFLLHDARLQCG